jgi:hypothetical protein
MGMERSPETEDAATDVEPSVGVCHCTSWTTGEAPDENVRVRSVMMPGFVDAEMRLERYDAVKTMLEPETE